MEVTVTKAGPYLHIGIEVTVTKADPYLHIGMEVTVTKADPYLHIRMEVTVSEPRDCCNKAPTLIRDGCRVKMCEKKT